MQPSIRRIDLTQSPASVDAWPSIDWLTDGADERGANDSTATGPHGRGGLWAAMASAVARAREASTGTANQADRGDGSDQAEVIDLVAEAPHLAYLARVACNADRSEDELADVIDFDELRARDLR